MVAIYEISTCVAFHLISGMQKILHDILNWTSVII